MIGRSARAGRRDDRARCCYADMLPR
jgi:hypothetical protein